MTDTPYINVSYNGKTYQFNCGMNDNLEEIRMVANEIFLDHSYTDGKCQINPGDVVIDGGAHLGMFTVFALINGASLVIAVEPNPFIFPMLQHNVERNVGKNRVVFINKALWDCIRERPNRLRFLHHKGHSQASFIRDKRVGNCWVKGTTIDTIRRRFRIIDFIKLDLEGSEQKALRGAGRTIKRNRPNLAVCLYHHGVDMVEIPNIVESFNAGYEEPLIKGKDYKVGLWNRPVEM